MCQQVILAPLLNDQIGHFSFQHIIATFSESLMYPAGEFRQDDCPIERFFLYKKDPVVIKEKLVELVKKKTI